MKKVSISSAGGYEKLVIVNDRDPQPGPQEILVDVKGIGVNYADTLVRLGVYASAKEYVGWPITPGFEVSGYVLAVGNQVTKFKPGHEVTAFTRFNGYSTRLCVNQAHALSVPKGFKLLESAGFPAVFSTAYYALKQIFTVRKGSRILVHSAAGGVGSAMVQIAKAEGHFVAGIVGSSHKVDYVKKMGADLVIDKSAHPDFWQVLRKQGLEGKFDVVYDANGYTTISEGYKFLRPTGKLVVYGSHSLLSKSGGRINWPHLIYGYLKTKRFSPMDLVTDNKSIIGFNISFLFDEVEMIKENMQGLSNYAENGLIYAPETTYVPFDQVAEAHKLIESGQTKGKIVLTVE